MPADTLTRRQRSDRMSKIRSKGTRPENVIRKLLYSNGFRYRLYSKDLPGKPDLVFKKYQAVVMVQGCFWHGHNCYIYRPPKSNQDFWNKKISRNQERDSEVEAKLVSLDWRVCRVWECAIQGKAKLSEQELLCRLVSFLDDDSDIVDIVGAN